MKKVTFTNATYRECSIAEHNDNYLISALPKRFSQKQFKSLMVQNLPKPDLELEVSDKITSILKMKKRVFIPTREHLNIYECLFSLMELGYDCRNPTDPSVIEWTADIADPDIPLPEIDEDSDTISDGMTILGKTGLGKSRSVERVLTTCFPQVILHNNKDFDDLQITYLKVDMPHDGSRGGLCKAILRAFDDVLKDFVDESYYEKYAKPHKARQASIPDMIDGIHTLMRIYHVGLLVVDELQNLLVEGLNNRNKTLQFFDSLSNNAEVPVLRIGTSDALNLFRKNHRHVRRAGFTVEVQPMDISSRYWNDLIDELFKYQMSSKVIELTDDTRAYLYELTQGYPYALIALWQQIQIYAVKFENTKVCLDHKKIKEIWKTKFPLLCRVFNAIKNGRTGQLDDILDAQHFIEIGNIDQAIKYINRAIRNSRLTGVAAQEIDEGLDVMLEGEELNPKQIEKLAKAKQQLQSQIGNIKKGQTYEAEQVTK
jgi:hypothetical protein